MSIVVLDSFLDIHEYVLCRMYLCSSSNFYCLLISFFFKLHFRQQMGYRPPILEALETPVSFSVAVLLIIICLTLIDRGANYPDVGSSWPLILDRGQYWRIISSAFSHFDFLHIAANVSSAWACRALEYVDGSLAMIKYIVILAITSGLLDCLIRKYFMSRSQPPISVGYSGVVCGLFAILSARSSSLSLFGFNIPWSAMPFVQIIMTSLLIPAASFIGHLSGTIIGFLISWHVFDWVTNRLFLNLAPWAVAFFLLNFVYCHRDRFSRVSVSRARLPHL